MRTRTHTPTNTEAQHTALLLPPDQIYWSTLSTTPGKKIVSIFTFFWRLKMYLIVQRRVLQDRSMRGHSRTLAVLTSGVLGNCFLLDDNKKFKKKMDDDMEFLDYLFHTL